MAYELSWLIKGRLIGLQLIGDITIDELVKSSDEIIPMLDTCDVPLVHLLIDETQMEHLPTQFKELLKSAAFFSHPRMGWFIIYGKDNQLLKFLSHLVSQVMKVRHRRFSTREEAMEFLYTVDVTLPEIDETEAHSKS